jgi:hypothetical protein
VLVDDASFWPAESDVEAGVVAEVSEPSAGVAAVPEVEDATSSLVAAVVEAEFEAAVAE